MGAGDHGGAGRCRRWGLRDGRRLLLPHINFHADPQQAQTYLQAHLGMTGELLGQADAVERARRSFGGLLDPQQRQAMGDNDLTRGTPWQ